MPNELTTKEAGLASLIPDSKNAREFQNLITNLMTTRALFQQNFLDRQRDINKECGYPDAIEPQAYRQIYDRNGIAKRVVHVYPEESWSTDPEIFESSDTDKTDFEIAWTALQKKFNLFSYMQRLDKVSGIGRYGVLLLGVNDGLTLDQPLKNIDEQGEFQSIRGAVLNQAESEAPTINVRISAEIDHLRRAYMKWVSQGCPRERGAVTNAEPMPDSYTGTTPAPRGVYDTTTTTPAPYLPTDQGVPATPKGGMQLNYLRVFDESLVVIDSYEKDLTNPRYGQPIFYNVRFVDVVTAAGATGTLTTVAKVHWSRIIHVADDLVSSEVLGTPRMQDVYNNLLDVRKILGPSAEMFYKGAFPGYSFEVPPNLEQYIEIDKEGMRKEFEAYSNGLQRYLALTGVQAKSLAPQVASPKDHFDTQVEAICISKAVPKRVFMGSERAELASTQDARAWNRRLNRRQNDHVVPHIIRPLIDRLIAVGILPIPAEYFVEFEDLNTPSDTERATVAQLETQALAAYVAGGVDQIVPPQQYFIYVLGWTLERAEEVIKSAEEQIASTEPPLARAVMAGDITDPNHPDSPLNPQNDPQNNPNNYRDTSPDSVNKPDPGTIGNPPIEQGKAATPTTPGPRQV